MIEAEIYIVNPAKAGIQVSLSLKTDVGRHFSLFSHPVSMLSDFWILAVAGPGTSLLWAIYDTWQPPQTEDGCGVCGSAIEARSTICGPTIHMPHGQMNTFRGSGSTICGPGDLWIPGCI